MVVTTYGPYTGSMVALWTYEPVVRKYWLANLRRLPPGARPNPDVLAMVSRGSLAAKASAKELRGVLEALRDEGVRVIPACATLSASYGHSYESWFDRQLWLRFGESLAQWSAARAPNDPRMAIDLEPYWDQEPRYPARPGAKNPYEEAYRVAETLAPFIAVIKHEGITPWLLPGGMEYAASWHIATACPDAVLLDEATYRCPLDGRFWQHYEKRKPGIEALRRGYLPGFYAVALRDPTFQEELRRREIGDYWIFFREPTDEIQRFWTPEWSRTPPTQPATSPSEK